MRTQKSKLPAPKKPPLPGDPLPTMPEGQRKILYAAIDEFAEHGYAATSTFAIAKRAGVSEALIFKYFKNKAMLLKQALFPVLAATLMPIAIRGMKNVAKVRHETFAAFVREFLKDRLDFARRHKKHLRILLQELPLNDELRAKAVAVLKSELFPVMRQKILEFQKTGELRAMPPETVLKLLAPQVIALVLGRTVFASEASVPDEEIAIAELIETMLCGVGQTASRTKNASRKREVNK